MRKTRITTSTFAIFLTFTTFIAEKQVYGVAANAANAAIKRLLNGAKSQLLIAKSQWHYTAAAAIAAIYPWRSLNALS